MTQTIEEIRKQYGKDKNAFLEAYTNKIKERLKEIHLDGLVRRKEDGRIGWLETDYYGALCFYPRTKEGKKSINQNGTTFYVETSFEPYVEE